MCLDAEYLFLFRIKDDDVRVRADGDCSFLWKQAKHFCGRGLSKLDKTIERNAVLNYPVVDQRHAMFDPGRAVGNIGKVIAAQLLLFLHAERTVLRSDDLQTVRTP